MNLNFCSVYFSRIGVKVSELERTCYYKNVCCVKNSKTILEVIFEVAMFKNFMHKPGPM